MAVCKPSDDATAEWFWTRYAGPLPRTAGKRPLLLFGICQSCYTTFGRALLPDLLDAFLVADEEGDR